MKKIIITMMVLSSVFTFTSCSSDDLTAYETTVETTYEGKAALMEAKTKDVTKSNIITDTVTYVGNVSDINIHMTLNYYQDKRIEGTYYYDKFGQEKQLIGEIISDQITLYTIDGSEAFKGTLTNNAISGEWTSGDKVLPFSVSLDNENYGKSTKSYIVKDDEHIYYIGNEGYYSSVYRCNLDGSENVKLADSGSSRSIDVVNNKVYYINTEMKLSRMDINGANNEVIFRDIDAIYDFIIYKDRIYFDNASEIVSDNETPAKLLSTNLNGEDFKEVKLPQFTFRQNEDNNKDYSISYIYKNNVYVASMENGPNADIYRVGLDGIDPNPTGAYGEVVGCANDRFYYMGVDSPDLKSRGVASDPTEAVDKIFTGKNININDVSEDENYTMNDRYIVYNYTTEEDAYHYITVLDLNGNVLNEISVEKSPNNYGGQYEYLCPEIIDDYIYFTVSKGYNKTGYLARVKILGDEVELLKTFK